MSLLDFDKILNYTPAPSLQSNIEHKLISSDFLKTSLKPPTILPEPWFFQMSHLTLNYVVFWSVTIGVSSNLWICRQNFSRQSSLLFQWLRRRVFERQSFSIRTLAFTNLSEWFFVQTNHLFTSMAFLPHLLKLSWPKSTGLIYKSEKNRSEQDTARNVENM